MSWLSRHWKTIAVVAASTVVFVGVTALTGGLGAPALVALGAGGFSSGVAGYGLGRWLDGQPVTVAGALTAGAVSTVVTVATAGVGRLVAPAVTGIVSPVVARVAPLIPGVAPEIVQNVTVGAALGGPLAAGGQVAENAVRHERLTNGVGEAFVTGVVTGALQDPLTRAIGDPIYSAAGAGRPSATRGIVGALENKPPAQGAREPAAAAAHEALNDYALDELARGTKVEDPVAARNATENQGHILRMVDTVEKNCAAIEALGIDPDATKAAILYSDLGKNADYLDAHAKKVFPDLYADPATRGLAKFKAFLLHEEAGIDLVRARGKAAGLSDAQIERIVDGIVGHNGPGTDGTWWQQQWDAQIANLPPSDASPLLGRSYPLPSKQAAVHTFLDRIDQGSLLYGPDGWAGGPKKIMNDNLNNKMTLEAAAKGALVGNPEGTLKQLDHLAELFPDVAQLDFVKAGKARVQGTVDLMSHVTFTDGGTRAVIDTPEGAIEATDFTSFWKALALVRPAGA